VYGADQGATNSPPPPGGREGGRHARYGFLVGRLHNRQITMEEATELFTIMQGMIQASEAARLALARVPTPPSPVLRPPPPPERALSAPATAGDDLLLVGILAMGAGAGLLAAMTKRIQDGTPAPNSGPTSRSAPGPSSRSG